MIQNGQRQNQNQNWKDFQLVMLWREHQGHGSIVKNELEAF